MTGGPEPKQRCVADRPKITVDETVSKAKYFASFDEIDDRAELATTKVSATLIIADSTFVPDSMRGRGVARAMIERMLDNARSAGQRVIPLCPFVRAYADRHRSDVEDVIIW